MHIPDGFVDPKTAVITGALAAGGLGVAIHHARKHLPQRKVPLLGLAAAFVFAAQMLNFPVLGGTSGHLIGGLLVAVLLGPAAAVIVISSVLIVQCLLFADGGITALGANIFNMAIIGGVGGWAIYALILRAIPGGKTSRIAQTLAIAVAAWISVVVASIVCAGELAASHTIGWSVAFPAMAGIHALIGIGEAIITVLVVTSIAQLRPELLDHTPATATTPMQKITGVLAFGLIISLGLAIFVAPFASPWPDGLEKVAEDHQFIAAAEQPLTPSPIPDYQMPGLNSESIATSAAGAAGVLICFGLLYLAARAVVMHPVPNPRRSSPHPSNAERS